MKIEGDRTPGKIEDSRKTRLWQLPIPRRRLPIQTKKTWLASVRHWLDK